MTVRRSGPHPPATGFLRAALRRETNLTCLVTDRVSNATFVAYPPGPVSSGLPCIAVRSRSGNRNRACRLAYGEVAPPDSHDGLPHSPLRHGDRIYPGGRAVENRRGLP